MSEIFHDKEVVCDAGSHATKKIDTCDTLGHVTYRDL